MKIIDRLSIIMDLIINLIKLTAVIFFFINIGNNWNPKINANAPTVTPIMANTKGNFCILYEFYANSNTN